MTRLFELVAIKREIFEDETNYDSETGEFLCEADLKSADGSIEQKALDTGVVIAEMGAEGKALRDQARVLLARAKSVESKQESLKSYLSRNLIEAGMESERVQDSRVSLNWRKVTKVQITNEELLPPTVWQVKRVVDKTQLLKDLKLEAVPGAELDTYQSLSVK